MRLKRLELQGFKSFATRTVLEFEEGITVIVGPNGSGKSNLADALRWVLGEQSTRALRTRRMEEVFFAGSSLRPRVGMAQVTLILDNSGGELPLEFSEIALTRRAYRSGESEYLINNQRARLRDVTELLRKVNLGPATYTFLGQGLVETLLTLRPEERRQLLEEAAGVRGHVEKMEEARQQLQECAANMERIGYILGEMRPHLARLQRQVAQAQDHQRIAQELEHLLTLWYSHQHQTGKMLSAEQEALLEASRKELEGIHTTITGIKQRQAEVRRASQECEQRLVRLRDEQDRLREQGGKLSRELAVAQVRSTLSIQQQGELEADIRVLDKEVSPLPRSLQQAGEELGRVEAEMAALSPAVKAGQHALEALEREMEKFRAQAQSAHQEEAGLQAELDQAKAALDELGESRGVLLVQETAWRMRREHLVTGLGEALHSARSARDQMLPLVQQQQETARVRQELAKLVQGSKGALEQLERLLRQKEQEWEEVELRLQRALAGDHGSLSGPSDQTPPWLSKLLGTLESVIQVPNGLDEAIQAALGGYRHGLILSSRTDAEAAVAYHTEREGQRVTLLPLDAIQEAPPLNLMAEPGVVGVASQLVGCPTQYRRLVDAVLGRTIVVEDLPLAWRVLRRGLGSVVTRSGVLLHPLAAISAGNDREMQYREQVMGQLPAQLREMESHCQGLRRQVQQERDVLAHHEATLAPLEEAERRLRDQVDALTQTVVARRREVDQLWRELQEGRRAGQERRERLSAVAASQEPLAQLLGQRRAQQLAAGAAREQARGDLLNLAQGHSPLAAEAAEQRSRQTFLMAQWREAHARKESVEASLTKLQGQLAEKRQRLRTLEGEIARLSQQLAQLQGEHHQVAEEQRRCERETQPLLEAPKTWAAEGAALIQEEERHRTRLLELERAVAALSGKAERAREDLSALELVAQQEGIVVTEASSDVLSPQDEQRVRGRIEHLRRTVRSLPSGSPETLEEYEATRARHDLLQSQLRDLEEGQALLQSSMADLAARADQEFRMAFARVQEEFQRYFATFFGGGTAKLVMMGSEDGAGGVEIEAQPPGKRLQSLALLSGGERALAATALLFALLSSNPAPFCLLDEADAALDEANISRFTEAVRELARDTQFILITHNRGTIEAAQTIYGISMGKDNTSQVLSLRLAEMAQS